MTQISRRGFGRLAVAGFGTAAGALAAGKIPIAVQLYSVRHIAQNDLAGVLKEVAHLGYEGVEFAGYYGHDAAAIRKMLNENRLKAAGTHTALDTLLGDNLAQTMEFNQTIGNKNLIVPSMPQKYRSSIAGWKEAAKLFSEISAKVNPKGFVVGYHNHTVEFEKLEGEIPFDVFFQTADKEVKVQLDIGHARRAGADPVDVINRYKGRVISVHVKEFHPENPSAALGDGLVKWNDVFHALQTVGGTEWFIAEEEAKTCQKFECIASSIERMRKILR